MKLSLALLFIFGFIAIAVAAPIEEDNAMPEEKDNELEAPLEEDDDEGEDPDTEVQDIHDENDDVTKRRGYYCHRVCHNKRRCYIGRCCSGWLVRRRCRSCRKCKPRRICRRHCHHG